MSREQSQRFVGYLLFGCGALVVFGLVSGLLAVGGYFLYQKLTAPTQFQEFTSQEFGFKALFPGTPRQETKTLPQGLLFTAFVWETKQGVYMIGCGDMPIAANEPINPDS